MKAISRTINQLGDKFRVYSSHVNFKLGEEFKPINTSKIRFGSIDSDDIIAREHIPARLFQSRNGAMICPDDSDDEAIFIELLDRKFDGVIKSTRRNIPYSEGLMISSGSLKVLTSNIGHKLFIDGDDKFEVRYKITLKDLYIDEYGRVFSSNTDEFRFMIGSPCLIDDEYKVIKLDNELDLIEGNLSKEPDGTYIYTKTPGPGFNIEDMPDVWYIDASVVYSETNDGFVTLSSATEEGLREAFTGATATSDSASNGRMVGYYQDYGTSVYWCARSFFQFDLSSINFSVASASLNLHAYRTGECGVTVQKATTSYPLTTNSYNDFTGSEFGRVTSWIQDYPTESGQLNTLNFNSTGITYLNTLVGSGSANLCVRAEMDYDDDPIVTGSDVMTTGRAGCYFRDEAGDNVPYLELTAHTIPDTFNTLDSNKWAETTLGGADGSAISNGSQLLLKSPTGVADGDVAELILFKAISLPVDIYLKVDAITGTNGMFIFFVADTGYVLGSNNFAGPLYSIAAGGAYQYNSTVGSLPGSYAELAPPFIFKLSVASGGTITSAIRATTVSEWTALSEVVGGTYDLSGESEADVGLLSYLSDTAGVQVLTTIDEIKLVDFDVVVVNISGTIQQSFQGFSGLNKFIGY